MKKLVSLILVGTMALSLAACGNNTPPKETEPEHTHTQEGLNEQPEYFKKFIATDKNVDESNKLKDIFLINDYENIWKKMTYNVFTFNKDGINGHVPKEEEDYVLSMTYDELVGADMKDIYMAMPTAYDGIEKFDMLAFISGDEKSSAKFEDFVLTPRDMTLNIGTLESIEGVFGCETNEDFLLYDYVLDTFGQPSEVSVQYDGDEKGFVLFAVYKMEDWTVTFAFGEYQESYRHLLIIEPVRETVEEQPDTPPTENDGVESPYKDKT